MTDQNEVTFDDSEIIVSKTDLKGKITYANHVFMKVSGYSETELLGKPHNIIRHPDMPRAVFKLLWDRIQQKKEVFAYVKNACKDGRYYWVFAHVTPTLDLHGNIIGYHSSRRTPNRKVLPIIEDLYAGLRQIEQQATSPKKGMAAAGEHLARVLAEKNMGYEEFIFSLDGVA
tara:strand:+ start:3274 stop:3792 length:519 start_codon:yes stop_codon:yes gene_type:complete